jgi:hypothetical protein
VPDCQKENPVAFQLHPDAATRFNSISHDLLGAVKDLSASQPRQVSTGDSGFVPKPFVAHHVTEDQLAGPVKVSLVDHFGNELIRYLSRPGETRGLDSAGTKQLAALAAAMQKTESLRHAVSLKTLKDLIFEWMESRVFGSTDLAMTEYVIAKCAELTKTVEIWIPIAMLHIQSEFEVGHVRLKTLTPQVFDAWREMHRGTPYETRMREVWDRKQQRMQSLAAATIVVTAEPHHACDVALHETEAAMSLLRVLWPGNSHPYDVSYCLPLGREHEETAEWFTWSEGRPHTTQLKVLRPARPWVISDKQLATLRRMRLDTLTEIYKSTKRTPFRNILLDALLLYSQASVAKRVSDKLVHILAALEMMLLKNESEPIQQNVAERIAFLIGRSVEQKRDIITNFKTVYQLRSRFVHHGQTMDDIESLRQLMTNVWTVFIALIGLSSRFNTRDDLLNELENRKLA